MSGEGLRERLAALPSEELVRISRSDDYTADARALARTLLSERGVQPGALPTPPPRPEDPRTSRRLRRWILAALGAAAISVVVQRAPGCEASLRAGYREDDLELARRVLEQASHRDLGSVVQRAKLRDLIRACELELRAKKKTAPSCEEMMQDAERLRPTAPAGDARG